jgi:hypothetical protein
MSDLDDMARKALGLPAPDKLPEKFSLSEDSFQDEYLDKQIKENGMVFCANCQRFIDPEQHNIAHVFARTSKEIREKTILERLAGKTVEGES